MSETVIRRRKRGVLKRAFIIFLVLCLITAAYINGKVLPLVYILGEEQLQTIIMKIMTAGVNRVLLDGNYSYGDFILLTRDESGAVISASVDTVRLNLFKNDVSLEIMRVFDTLDIIEICFTVGNLFDWYLFSGHGMTLNARLLQRNGVDIEVSNDFRAAGINQTLHSVSLDICARITAAVGVKKLQVTAYSDTVIAETIIVGKVPEVFASLDGLIA